MSPNRPSSESVKTFLLLLTFVWAIYTFVWKEHVVPSFQEPKIEINSAIETVGDPDSGLIRLAFKIKNTSLSSVELLQDNWALYKLVRLKPGTDQQFLKRLDAFLDEGSASGSIERSSIVKPGALLAAGSLDLGSLKSGESTSFSKLIKLSPGTKEIYLNITIPFSPIARPNEADLGLQWEYDRNDGMIKPLVCKPDLGATTQTVRRTCYSYFSQPFRQWQKQNKIYTTKVNESFAVQSRN
jgi:hypothetical protein